MPGQMIPTGVATGGAGAIFRTPVVQAIAAAGNFVLPVGTFVVYAVGADVRMQVQDSAGAWQNVTAIAVGIPCVISDGTNVRFQNAGAGSENITYIQIG